MNQPQMNTDKHGFFLMVGRVTPCAPIGHNQRFGGQGTARPTDPCPSVSIRG